MAGQMSDQEIYEEARRRVGEKRRFYGHLVFYAVVNIICVFVWAFASGGGYPWFLWVLGSWGILIVLPHFLRIFIFERRTDRRAIEKEVERIKREGS